MAGYVRQALANIQPNLNINAEDFNAEFNALQTAFDSVLGHTHDGSLGQGGRVGRLILNTNTTFYVSPSGSDSASGLTPATPWLTIQHAWNFLLQNYDLAGFQATIQLAAGTYTTGLVASSTIPGQVNANLDDDVTDSITGGVIILGDLITPSNVFINCTTNIACISTGLFATLRVAGVKLSATGGSSSFCAITNHNSVLKLNTVEFAACDNAHVKSHGGKILLVGANKITGNAVSHFVSKFSGAHIENKSTSYTLTGTPAFSSTFASVSDAGTYHGNAAFTGAATGVRYIVSANGVADTIGSGASYFPGDSAGSTATGGQYI